MMTRKPSTVRLLAVPMTFAALFASSCSDDDGPTGSSDTTAPGAVVNLAIGEITSNSVRLTWTATGDDGGSGTARHYDIRYSMSAITASNFDVATTVVDVPVPTVSGSSQNVTVSGLTANTTYHFAMKAGDEVTSWAGISNRPNAITLAADDLSAPTAVSDLSTDQLSPTSVRLSWTATGDNGAIGTATTYDVRYATSAITTANFATTTAVVGEPTPGISGSTQQMTVTGLAPNTTYHFVMRTADEVPNWSGLSNQPIATTQGTPDTAPPSAITNLSASPIDANRVRLTWTAPGDDGTVGSAQDYDVRYATSAITATSFATATQVTNEPVPTTSGTTQELTVSGLLANTTYFFAMKSVDEATNMSLLSNSASALTP